MKAILVLNEIPNSCEECPLRYWGIGGWSCISTRRLLEGPIAEREEWCPLRPLPKEEEPTDEVVELGSYNEGYGNGYECGFTDGWNACLKELEK